MTLGRLLQLARRARTEPGQTVVVVGLGNPGPQYQNTRHNIGFHVVDELARRLELPFQLKGPSVLASGRMAGRKLVLCKPQTWMNRSGEAVVHVVRGTTPGLLVVAYDDLDLPPGQIRIRDGGGAGGHKGMESVLSCLNSEQVPRLRIGIGRPSDGTDVVSWVLSAPSTEDASTLARAVQSAADAVGVMVGRGIQVAMEQYN